MSTNDTNTQEVKDIDVNNGDILDGTKEIWITTEDNPFDPFTQSRHWFWWDESHGYGTCGLVDRLAHTSDNLSDVENDLRINHAINDILEHIPIATGILDSNGNPRYASAYTLAVKGKTRAY